MDEARIDTSDDTGLANLMKTVRDSKYKDTQPSDMERLIVERLISRWRCLQSSSLLRS